MDFQKAIIAFLFLLLVDVHKVSYIAKMGEVHANFPVHVDISSYMIQLLFSHN